MKNKYIPNGINVSSLGSLCLRLSRLSWRSRAMMAAMEKSVAQGRAEQSSSMARSRPSPCSSIKLPSEPSLPPAHTPSPSEHPIGGTTGHSLCNFKFRYSRLDAMLISSTIHSYLFATFEEVWSNKFSTKNKHKKRNTDFKMS